MRGRSKRRHTSRTLSVRLPNQFADIIEAAAKASGQSTSEYIEARLRLGNPAERPLLAALAALMQIARSAREQAVANPVPIGVVERLIGQMISLAREEAER